jgi:hypothetical protein
MVVYYYSEKIKGFKIMTENEYKSKKAYNEKTYTRLNIALKKALCEEFKEKIKSQGLTINGVFTRFVENYVNENKD